MIDTIFFDLGNVLVDVNKKLAISAIAKLLRLKTGKVNSMIDLDLEQKFEVGKLTSTEYIDILNERFDSSGVLNLKKLVQIWALAFPRKTPVCELLENLRDQAAIFMLSNTNAIHIRAIKKTYDLLDKFDGRILSFELGTRKPDREIYAQALKIAKSEPERSVFIDDLSENIAAARTMGIESHQYRNIFDLKQFLITKGFYLDR